jgi:hypothetical protein
MPHNAMDYLKEWDNEFETNSSLIGIYPLETVNYTGFNKFT